MAKAKHQAFYHHQTNGTHYRRYNNECNTAKKRKNNNSCFGFIKLISNHNNDK